MTPTDSDAPPIAPPTVPGERPRAKPTSKLAVASMVTGILGLVIPPSAIAAIVLGIMALRGLGRDATQSLQGKGFAIAGVCSGGAGVLFSVVWIMVAMMAFASVQTMQSVRALMTLEAVHVQAQVYAAQHGTYPDHIARLVPAGPVSSPVQSMVMTGMLDEPTSVRVGDYDAADYDETPEAAAALTAALDALDHSAPTYRFGDFWFVRLPTPTGDPDIVFGWWHDPDADYIGVVMEDSGMRPVGRDGWLQLWEDDAVARIALGFPEIKAPPAPPEEE